MQKQWCGWIAGWTSLIGLVSCAPVPSENPPQAEQHAVQTEIQPEKPSARPDEKKLTDEQAPAQRSAKGEVVEYEPPPKSDDTFTLEEGFKLLTLDDFEAFQADSETWSVFGDGIRSTGKPKGYLYSKDEYQNFTWRLEYRFERPKSLEDESKFKGNTGFMIYINGEHKIWPVSLEVQGKHTEMAAIKANGGASPVTAHEVATVRETARLPVGQWNRLEIISRDGALAVTLNDLPLSHSESNFLSAGLIGIQAEDHPFVVRHLRIRRD